MKKVNVLILTIIFSIIFLGVEIVIIRKSTQYEAKRNVVYADIDIKAGEIIKEEMLVEKETGISSIHDQAFVSKEDVIGKKAKTQLFKGEMILKGRLDDELENGEIHEKSNDEKELYRKFVFRNHKISFPADEFNFKQSNTVTQRGGREMSADDLSEVADSLRVLQNNYN